MHHTGIIYNMQVASGLSFRVQIFLFVCALTFVESCQLIQLVPGGNYLFKMLSTYHQIKARPTLHLSWNL